MHGKDKVCANHVAPAATPYSRILLDIPCKVCQDHSSGKHYGIFACDGCAGFFKRSIRRHRQYVCKNRGNSQEGVCIVDKTHRNQCRACRLRKCVQIGMNKDAVQHERGPRNSTLRRQMATYFKDGARPSVADDVFFRLPNAPPSSVAFPLFAAPPPFAPFPFLPPFLASPPISTAPPRTAASPPKFSISQLTAASPRSANSGSDDAEHKFKEKAARLLFLAINWPKTLPQFLSQPMDVQTETLKETWPSLFLLAALQFKLFADEADGRPDGLQLPASLSEMTAQFDQLHPDAVEIACLRSLILMSGQPLCVEQMQMALARYEQLQNAAEPMRSMRLLLLLPALRLVERDWLELHCFRDSIGDVPMSRLIGDLYAGASTTRTQTLASPSA